MQIVRLNVKYASFWTLKRSEGQDSISSNVEFDYLPRVCELAGGAGCVLCMDQLEIDF